MRQEKMYVGRGLSFMGSIVAKTEVGRLGGRLPGWPLAVTSTGSEFIDLLNVRRPATYTRGVRFADLELTPGTVVKPDRGSGSFGCYLVYAEDDVVHVKDGRTFRDRDDLQRHAMAVLKDRSSVTSATKDRWSVEELILRDKALKKPAVDLKFWTFYGQVAFINEVNQHPETRRDFWSREGERISPPGSWGSPSFEGEGVKPEYVELVERISLEIPYPFMRIDMLHGDGELIFGEFTPRPGGSDYFTPEWDRHLGEMWGLAENRLQQDLLEGKEFAAYSSLIKKSRRKQKNATPQARKKRTQS
jgi:hypothetical protein